MTTNPFTDKREDGTEYCASLQELLDMAPGLSDPELDALCAAVCEDKWIKWSAGAWKGFTLTFFYPIRDVHWDYRPTTDWREAGRLLVKYRMDFTWYENCPEAAGCVGPRPGRKYEFKKDKECRAITLAAVTAELTRMIEGDGE